MARRLAALSQAIEAGLFSPPRLTHGCNFRRLILTSDCNMTISNEQERWPRRDSVRRTRFHFVFTSKLADGIVVCLAFLVSAVPIGLWYLCNGRPAQRLGSVMDS